ncbi:type 2 lanthipeptide synthetase LanM family protein [Paraburkholderia sp. D15]|uniref:type 2 lanthipeptide synthetase LanM family protein n=1 Tax=Paraburkholderia sp. D15 TaxID=2880218 RepID=UPI00247A0ECD|nr:type 2 lanthipeptide synthetase LanM family protein [Paraburkholderia sp. D15]WGS49940.1 type 2 lanthipeptide synthetase LanM family protein [Paraburkholderia sp. D15]
MNRALGVLERAGCSDEFNDVIAEARLQRWLESPAFSNRRDFEQFLRDCSVSEETFTRCLGIVPDSEGVQSVPSSWFANEAIPSGKAFASENGIGSYLSLVEPLLRESTSQVQATVDAQNDRYGSELFSGRVVESLADALYEQILLVIVKPLTLELRIASISGTLRGDVGEDRFKDFANDLCRPETRQRLFSQYPVMLAHCLRVCDQWRRSVTEFLERTAKDILLLQKSFCVGQQVLSAQVSTGDAHNEGRRVVIVDFTDGKRLVYKPRSLKVESHFQDLLQWLNDKGLDPALRTIRVLDRDSYGWSEFVEASDCVSMEDIQLFYRRVGVLLALLYAVGATDAHFENLIAEGAHPVLVDLETLFHPSLAIDNDGSGSTTPSAANRSVLSVGLLPTPVRVGDQIVDMSGLGARPNEKTQLQTMGFDAVGTDEMHITRVQFVPETTSHLPRLQGRQHRATEHIQSVLEGFRTGYRLLVSCAGELLAAEGPIAVFADCEVRVLLRPTATYASLLQESYHPHALSDGTECDRVLAQIWSNATSNPIWAVAAPHEFAQLRRGDVPYFSCHTASTTVSSGDGTQLNSILSSTGFESVQLRIVSMDEADLCRQEWIICASFASLGEGGTDGSDALKGCEPWRGCGSENAQIAAVRMLDTLAFKHGDSATWLTFAPVASRSSASSLDHIVTEVGIDLYDGLAGIAFFLLASAKFAGDSRGLDLGWAALNELERRLAMTAADQPYGAFSGISGVLYVYAHVATWFPEVHERLKARTGLLVPIVAEKLRDDEACDLISGRAGTILCLLAVHDAGLNESALDLATQCGSEIVRILNKGAAHEVSRLKLPNYRGISHGLSGVAMAMVALGNATHESIFVTTALAFFSLEGNMTEGGVWTDPHDLHHVGQATWCHGAPGIALARLTAYSQLLGEPLIEREARRVLGECLKLPLIDNESLCHGNLGNLDVLALAVDVFPCEQLWGDEIEEKRTNVQALITREGLRCARPGYIPVPSLMTGVAGIGYGALRMSFLSGIPCVLTLAPPFSTFDDCGKEEQRVLNRRKPAT